MKRVGIILILCTLWATNGFAVSRISDTSTTTRSGTTNQRVKTQTVTSRQKTRVATTKNTSRVATKQKIQTKNNARAITNRAIKTTTNARSGIMARAASSTTTTTSDTRTGSAYEQCKNAYFSCMDQFCQLKNDDYRRCSCSDRITSLQSALSNLQQADEQLTAFNENLDIVGKTAAQAAAMNTASDGELALSSDTSASTALLNAIMNSINGTKTTVENNQLSTLNSIDLSFDTTNSFGTDSVGQTIASYNGITLYSAVYSQCKNAVTNTCNDASLQRAVNAYLMAIEQDCNTVQTAITTKQKEAQAAIRESSAMLDMARAENHQAHNSDDLTTCLTNVESAILSEDVCGSNYHKCLDNGEYIDVSTGEPIAGVVDFYKLGEMLTFNSERNNTDQKLAQNPSNRTFVTNFEKRVKQFAEPALDKCYDDADTVWQDYLNKALLDIYYAQQSKVTEIKQGCFDFVSACYMNGSTALTDAMQGLVAAQTTTLTPNTTTLNLSLCSDYIKSCNNMFDGQIVQDYVDNRQSTDTLTACRAVVKQCFDNYGGTNYENFYNPNGGLFDSGHAPDWFSLYECSDANCATHTYKSECAKQLVDIDACSDPDMIEQAFGGFNYYPNNSIYSKYASLNSANQIQNRLLRSSGVATEIYNQIIDILQTNCENTDGKFINVQNLALYSNNYNSDNFCQETFHNSKSRYNHLITDYSTGKYSTKMSTIGSMKVASTGTVSLNTTSTSQYSIKNAATYINENICPSDYNTNVDAQSWGTCSCWENGGRRSNNGTSTRCVATFPVISLKNYNITYNSDDTYSAEQVTTHGTGNTCINTDGYITTIDSTNKPVTPLTHTFNLWPYTIFISSYLPTEQDWCTAEINSSNQVCPFGVPVLTSSGSGDDAGLGKGDCANCRTGWEIVDASVSESEQRCCPSGYSLQTNSVSTLNNSNGLNFGSRDSTTKACCPNGYNTYNGTTCSNSNNNTQVPVTPTHISKYLMQQGDSLSFPEG